jgi:hypothetical protein
MGGVNRKMADWKIAGFSECCRIAEGGWQHSINLPTANLAMVVR